MPCLLCDFISTLKRTYFEGFYSGLVKTARGAGADNGAWNFPLSSVIQIRSKAAAPRVTVSWQRGDTDLQSKASLPTEPLFDILISCPSRQARDWVSEEDQRVSLPLLSVGSCHTLKKQDARAQEVPPDAAAHHRSQREITEVVT